MVYIGHLYLCQRNKGEAIRLCCVSAFADKHVDLHVHVCELWECGNRSGKQNGISKNSTDCSSMTMYVKPRRRMYGFTEIE